VETYSQTPCAEDARPITVTPPAKLSSDPLNEAELIDQCVTYLNMLVILNILIL
jgi:hypothetical protein